MKLQLLNIAKLGGCCLNLLLVPASLKFCIRNETCKAENEASMACVFDGINKNNNNKKKKVGFVVSNPVQGVLPSSGLVARTVVSFGEDTLCNASIFNHHFLYFKLSLYF